MVRQFRLSALLGVAVAAAACVSLPFCFVGGNKVSDALGKGATAQYRSRVDEGINQGYGPEKVFNTAGYISVSGPAPITPAAPAEAQGLNSTADKDDAIPSKRRHLWFWFFESRSDPQNDPLVLWLTGVFMENGPYVIDANSLRLSLNPYSWNTRANVLYVDQPAGTGFSWAHHSDPGAMNEREVAKDMDEFLRGFLERFPKYQGNKLILTGESYAGHFIPALAAQIVRSNEQGAHPKLNLQALAMGNPLVNPLVQYRYYAPFAHDHGVVNDQQYEVMMAQLPGCLQLIEQCSQQSETGWESCLEAHSMCAVSQWMPVAFSGMNVYDVRRPCGAHALCYDMSPLERFLGQPEVISALGVQGHKWASCKMKVNQRFALSGDWLLNFASDLPKVLAQGVRVVVYAGDADWICSWYGNDAWTRELQWSGQSAFGSASNSTWVVNGTDAGVAHTANGLTFVRVFNAGHMVPMDQPTAALDLLDRVISGQEFDGAATILPSHTKDDKNSGKDAEEQQRQELAAQDSIAGEKLV